MAINGERVPVVTLSDIADYLDYHKEVLWRLINGDALLKEWSVIVVTTMTDGTNYEVLALTLDGFIGLMVKNQSKKGEKCRATGKNPDISEVGNTYPVKDYVSGKGPLGFRQDPTDRLGDERYL